MPPEIASPKTPDLSSKLYFKQQREGLTLAEKERLEQLVHQYDQAVLLRAEAAQLLKARGHDVSELLTTR